MILCIYCGKEIEEHEYRHRFPIHLSSEDHGTLVIQPRDVLAELHPVCCIALGSELINEGKGLLGQHHYQDEFKTNLGNYLNQI